ncbi:hypothetical protein RHGRI_030444 [Rhododendron griersonianum]|uniref:Uncharacterized protein n=1 Tax=Rhododendron griersonianum TaxID=479676 RepID=A0AAV6INL1_9ERIC|nr:hypothetical protein RHGRI_030444 [Rhododendron griersonianum]
MLNSKISDYSLIDFTVIVESSTPEKGLDNIWTSTGEEVESGSRIPDSRMVVKRMDDCKADSND